MTTAAAAAVATAPTAVKQVLLSGGRLERGQTGKIKALKAAGETGELEERPPPPPPDVEPLLFK